MRRWSIGEDYRSLLVLTQEPITVRQAGGRLRFVRFHLVNFPGLQEHPTHLRAGSWSIEVRPDSELSETRKRLAVESGNALTHEGCIRRSDGGPFTVGEADKLIHILHLFFSFARGGNCGVTLVSGRDVDGAVWEKWGAYPTYPWFHTPSWLDHRFNNGESLSSAFRGFWQLLEPRIGASVDPIRVALYWYLQSNETDAPYTGIILTQAALERLGNQFKTGGATQAAASRIRAALQGEGINTEIPEACKELRRLHEVDRTYDGPGLLSALRNDLVHAEIRRPVCLEAYLEAHDLGQWYVELLLLRLFGYTGQYANRLAYKYEGNWRPTNVPWEMGE